jgi:hypothetical protein
LRFTDFSEPLFVGLHFVRRLGAHLVVGEAVGLAVEHDLDAIVHGLGHERRQQIHAHVRIGGTSACTPAGALGAEVREVQQVRAPAHDANAGPLDGLG